MLRERFRLQSPIGKQESKMSYIRCPNVILQANAMHIWWVLTNPVTILPTISCARVVELVKMAWTKFHENKGNK